MASVDSLCRDRFDGAPRLGRVLDGFRVRCAVDRAIERGLVLHVRDHVTGDTWTAGNGKLIRWSAACPSGEEVDADPARELYETCGKAAIVDALVALGEVEPTEEEAARLAKTRHRPGKILVPLGCGAP